MPILLFITKNSKSVIFLVGISILIGVGIGMLLFFMAPALNGVLWNSFRIAVPAEWLRENDELALHIGDSYFIDAVAGEYDLERAQEYYMRALQINPSSTHPWMRLGRIDFLNGYFYSAVAKYNKVVEGEENINVKDHTGFYYWRGLANGYLRKFEDAENDFLQVLKGHTESGNIGAWAAYVDLAWIYFQEGKFEEIKTLLEEEALLHYPQNPWVLSMYGVALYNLDDTAGARKYLESALFEAEKFTPLDWEKAYPGNNPLDAEQGLANLLEAIRSNYALTEKLVDK